MRFFSFSLFLLIFTSQTDVNAFYICIILNLIPIMYTELSKAIFVSVTYFP